MMTIPPSLVSLWLVDNVTRDDAGGSTLHRAFNRLMLPSGATEWGTPFIVFFAYTDARVRCACELRLTELSGLEQVYVRPVYLDPVGPAEVADMTLRVNTLPLAGPGEYVWELFHGTHRLGSTRMSVVSRQVES